MDSFCVLADHPPASRDKTHWQPSAAIPHLSMQLQAQITCETATTVTVKISDARAGDRNRIGQMMRRTQAARQPFAAVR